MLRFRVSLFGKFRIQNEDRTWYVSEHNKAQELLGYLLIRREEPQWRSRLADFLWTDYSHAQSRRCLRQTLWQLQHCCETFLGANGRRLLLVDPEQIRFSPDIDLWTDVSYFEAAGACLQPGTPLDVNTLREAVSLYSGELLEGWYQDWCLSERERMQHLYMAMLNRLTAHAEETGDFETGLDYSLRLLQCDRTREKTHQARMRLYYFSGDRPAALQQYEQCAAMLRQELGVAPSRKTTELYEMIRADQVPLPAGSMTPELPPPSLPGSEFSMDAVLIRLRQLQDTMSTLQRQVQEDIRLLETLLPHTKNRP
ncbi:MAG: BTAD domain-containing putative transcriptional regulator [Blastocatellia bacterium]